MCIQIPDTLDIGGFTYSIEPLPTWPRNSVDVVRNSTSDMPSERSITTAFVRGVQCYWEIKNNELYLTKMEGMYRLRNEAAVFAGWFNGLILTREIERIAIQVESGLVKDITKQPNNFSLDDVPKFLRRQLNGHTLT